MPPTTPPAIAPVFELLLEDDGEDVLDAMMDWLLLVELGTTEALPVTSGESVTVKNAYRKWFVDKSTYHQQAALLLHSRNQTAGKMRRG